MANGHGGRRKGAGRPKGIPAKTRQKITEEIVERRLARSDMLPLSVMVTLMEEALKEGDKDKAFARAKECAPYIHARLSNVEQTNHNVTDASEVSDAELAAIAAGRSEGASEAEDVEETASRVH